MDSPGVESRSEREGLPGRTYSDSGSESDDEWSLSRNYSSGSFSSSLGSMGSLSSINLAATDAASSAPWWMPSKAMAVVLRDFVCQILDWIVAGLMSLCWQLRPSAVSLVYGLMAAWMLVWKPQMPQLLHAAEEGQMPFPRMLRAGILVAFSAVVLHVALRLKHGNEPPRWVVDYLALTNHTSTDAGASSFSYAQDNAPEIVMLVSGLCFYYVWRQYGKKAAENLKQRKRDRDRSRSSYASSISRTLSRSSSTISGWGGAADAGGQEEGIWASSGMYDPELDNAIGPSSAVACCGLVSEEYARTVREVVEEVVAQQRNPRTTAVWMKGMNQWVTLDELIANDSFAQTCCRRCSRRGRLLCRAAVGRASWAHTKVAISLALTRLWTGVVERTLASPMHGGALACLVLVTNYSNSPFATPYFILLAGYLHSWFRVSAPTKLNCCCPTRINTMVDGPNYLQMAFLHRMMSYYAVLELFVLYCSRATPIESNLQELEHWLNSTEWFDFSGVNPSALDLEHNEAREWLARIGIILSHTIKAILDGSNERDQGKLSGNANLAMGGGRRRRNVFHRLIHLTSDDTTMGNLKGGKAASSASGEDTINVVDLQSVLEWINMATVSPSVEFDECEYTKKLPELLRKVADPDSDQVNFSGFCSLLAMLSQRDRNLIADVVGTEDGGEERGALSASATAGGGSGLFGSRKRSRRADDLSVRGLGQSTASKVFQACDDQQASYLEFADKMRQIRSLKNFLLENGAVDGSAYTTTDLTESSSDDDDYVQEEGSLDRMVAQLINGLQMKILLAANQPAATGFGLTSSSLTTSTTGIASAQLPRTLSSSSSSSQDTFTTADMGNTNSLDISVSTETETSSLLDHDPVAVDQIELEPEPKLEPLALEQHSEGETNDSQKQASTAQIPDKRGCCSALKQRFAAGMTSLGLGTAEMQQISEDTKIYVSVRPSELSELQTHIRRYLDANRPLQSSTNDVRLKYRRSEPLAIWSEGMDQWVPISKDDMQHWVTDANEDQELQSGSHVGRRSRKDSRGTQPNMDNNRHARMTPYPLDSASVFLKVVDAVGVFAVTVSYIGALIVWSVYEITPSSPVLALMASVTTFAPHVINIAFLLYVIQIIALVQWSFGILGFGVRGQWAPLFDTWVLQADVQQLIAWVTMFTVGMLREKRAKVTQDGNQDENAALFNVLVGVLRITAAGVMTVCGLYRASFINLLYALIGTFLLVWRISYKKAWAAIFVASSAVICLSLVLYIVPTEFIRRSLKAAFVVTDGATQTEVEDEAAVDEYVGWWNAILTVSGLRGCDQITRNAANNTEIGLDFETIDFDAGSLDCVGATFGRSYAVLCSVGLYLWGTRLQSTNTAAATAPAKTETIPHRDEIADEVAASDSVEKSALFRTILRSSFLVLLSMSAFAVSSLPNPAYTDSIVFLMVLIFVPNELKYTQWKSGWCMLILWYLPLMIAIITTAFQYLSRIEQLECWFVTKIATSDIAEQCKFEATSIGNCPTQEVRDCVMVYSCLRTGDFIDRISNRVEAGLQRLQDLATASNATELDADVNETCVLSPEELGLYASSDQDFWHNLVFGVILMLYFATAKSLRMLKHLNQARDDFGATFARAVVRWVPNPHFRYPVVMCHTAFRCIRLVATIAAPNAIIFVTFVNSQRDVSIISAVYWLFTVRHLLHPLDAHKSWVSLFLWAFSAYLVQYLWQFDMLRSIELEHPLAVTVIGLQRVENLEGNFLDPHFTGHLAVIFSLVLVRRLMRISGQAACSAHSQAVEDVFCGRWSASPLYKTSQVTLHVHNETTDNYTITLKSWTRADGRAATPKTKIVYGINDAKPSSATVYVSTGSLLELHRTSDLTRDRGRTVLCNGDRVQHVHVCGTSQGDIIGPHGYHRKFAVEFDGMLLPLPPDPFLHRSDWNMLLDPHPGLIRRLLAVKYEDLSSQQQHDLRALAAREDCAPEHAGPAQALCAWCRALACMGDSGDADASGHEARKDALVQAKRNLETMSKHNLHELRSMPEPLPKAVRATHHACCVLLGEEKPDAQLLGAWPHLCKSEVEQFGAWSFSASNFLIVYGDILRSCTLLLASVTLTYSLAVLYIISLYEMKFKDQRRRRKFSRNVCIALVLVHTAATVAAVLLRANYEQHVLHSAQTFLDKIQAELSMILYFGHASLGADNGDNDLQEEMSWANLFQAGHVVDIQSFVVLFIASSILQSHKAMDRLTQACHEYYMDKSRARPLAHYWDPDSDDQESRDTGALAVTKALARACKISHFSMLDYLHEERRRLSNPSSSAAKPKCSGCCPPCLSCCGEKHTREDVDGDEQHGLQKHERRLGFDFMPVKDFENAVSQAAAMIAKKTKGGIVNIESEKEIELWRPTRESNGVNAGSSMMLRSASFSGLSTGGGGILTALSGHFGYPGKLTKLVIRDSQTSQEHNLIHELITEDGIEQTWRHKKSSHKILLSPGTTSVTVLVDADCLCKVSLRKPPDEAFDVVLGMYSRRIEVGQQGTNIFVCVDNENPNEQRHELEGVQLGIRLERRSSMDHATKGATVVAVGASSTGVQDQNSQQAGGSSTSRSIPLTRHESTAAMGHNFKPYVRWKVFAELVSLPDESKRPGASNGSADGTKKVIDNLYGINVAGGSPQFSPSQLVASVFWFYFPDWISMLVLLSTMRSSSGGLWSLQWSTKDVASFEYDFFASVYVVLALNLTLDFHADPSTTRSFRSLSLVAKATEYKARVVRNVSLLRRWNYFHLVSQGVYLVIESFWNRECSVTATVVQLQEQALPDDCVGSVKKASFVDTQWSALADALRASDDMGVGMPSSAYNSAENPDMFGTILGLDNGVANVGNFGRAALLFLIITFTEIIITSPRFGAGHGGVMWFKAKAQEQVMHRKWLYLVRRAQLSHQALRKHQHGMDFLRSMLRKMNESSNQQRLDTYTTPHDEQIAEGGDKSGHLFKVTVTGADENNEAANGVYYSNNSPSSPNTYDMIWGSMKIWKDDNPVKGQAEKKPCPMWRLSDVTLDLDDSFEKDTHGGSTIASKSEIRHFYSVPSTTQNELPETGWVADNRFAAEEEEEAEAEADEQEEEVTTLPEDMPDSARAAFGLRVKKEKCGFFHKHFVFTFQLWAKNAALQSSVLKLGHLDAAHVSRSLKLNDMTSTDVVLLVLESMYVHYWHRVVFFLMVLHALIDHDIPSIGLLVIFLALGNHQWPRTQSGFWFFATALVSFEIAVRYVLNWKALNLWLTNCVGSEFGFLSYCTLIDDSGSTALVVLLLAALCFQKDVDVRSGRYRSWAKFTSNARPSLERQELPKQASGHVVSSLNALSDATGVAHALTGLHRLAHHTAEQVSTAHIPSRCRHCKREELKVTSCIHEIHTLASPADAMGSKSTDAEQLPRIHLCRSCGSAIEIIDLDRDGLNARPANTKQSRGVTLFETVFSPPRLERFYKFNGYYNQRVRDLFVWARDVEGEIIMVAVANPTRFFWEELAAEQADAIGDQDGVHYLHHASPGKRQEAAQAKIIQLCKATAEELDNTQVLDVWKHRWPQDLKVPQQVYVCGCVSCCYYSDDAGSMDPFGTACADCAAANRISYGERSENVRRSDRALTSYERENPLPCRASSVTDGAPANGSHGSAARDSGEERSLLRRRFNLLINDMIGKAIISNGMRLFDSGPEPEPDFDFGDAEEPGPERETEPELEPEPEPELETEPHVTGWLKKHWEGTWHTHRQWFELDGNGLVYYDHERGAVGSGKGLSILRDHNHEAPKGSIKVAQLHSVDIDSTDGLHLRVRCDHNGVEGDMVLKAESPDETFAWLQAIDALISSNRTAQSTRQRQSYLRYRRTLTRFRARSHDVSNPTSASPGESDSDYWRTGWLYSTRDLPRYLSKSEYRQLNLNLRSSSGEADSPTDRVGGTNPVRSSNRFAKDIRKHEELCKSLADAVPKWRVTVYAHQKHFPGATERAKSAAKNTSNPATRPRASAQELKLQTIKLVPRSLTIESPIDYHQPPDWIPIVEFQLTCDLHAYILRKVQQGVRTGLKAAYRRQSKQRLRTSNETTENDGKTTQSAQPPVPAQSTSEVATGSITASDPLGTPDEVFNTKPAMRASVASGTIAGRTQGLGRNQRPSILLNGPQHNTHTSVPTNACTAYSKTVRMVHMLDTDGQRVYTKASSSDRRQADAVVVALEELELDCGDAVGFKPGSAKANAENGNWRTVKRPLPKKKSEAVKILRKNLQKLFQTLNGNKKSPIVSAPRVLIGQEAQEDYWDIDTHPPSAHYLELDQCQAWNREVSLGDAEENRCECRRCALVKAGMVWADISSKRVERGLLKRILNAAEHATPAAPDDRKPAVGGPRIGGALFGLTARVSAWLRSLHDHDLKRNTLISPKATDSSGDQGDNKTAEDTISDSTTWGDAHSEVFTKKRSSQTRLSKSETVPPVDGAEPAVQRRQSVSLLSKAYQSLTQARDLSSDSSASPLLRRRRAVMRFRLDEKAHARRHGGRRDDKMRSGDIVFMNEDEASTGSTVDGSPELWELEWRPVHTAGGEAASSDEGWLHRDELPEEMRPGRVALEAEELEFLPSETTVVALHDFEPVRGHRDLRLEFGQRVIVIDYGDKPWWLGYLEKDENRRLGEFPSNYCQAAIVPPIRTHTDEWSVSQKEMMRAKSHWSVHGDPTDTQGDIPQAEDLPHKLRRDEVGYAYRTVLLESVSLFVACRAYTEHMQLDIGAVTSSFSDESGSPMQMSMWLLAMLQFYFIILDRAFYLRKAVAAKLVLLWISIVVYCCIIFSMWDFNAPRPFSFLGLWLLLKCAYWYLCGIQVRHGFGDTVTNFKISSLTESTAKLNHYAFIVFDNAPFLSEICCILEWTCFKTTLELVDALKLDRMKAVTYLARCRWARLQEADRAPGQTQLFKTKVIFGFGAFLVLSALIWGPALLMASLSVLSKFLVHNVESASLQADLVLQGVPGFVSADLNGNFTLRLFESSFHSVRALSTDPTQLLSEPTLSNRFLSQYKSYGSGSNTDTSYGFWWGPKEKVFADQVQDLLLSGAADTSWQPLGQSMSDRVARYLEAVGNADPERRTHAKLVLTITLLKKDALGKVERIDFPSSQHDSWTSRAYLDKTQATTLQTLLSWGQQLSAEQESDVEVEGAAGANFSLGENEYASAGYGSASSTGQQPSRCIFQDEKELVTRRSASLRLPAAYPPLLFVENDGTVYPMDSRQHDCVAPYEWPCPASAEATRANAVEIWLERRVPVDAGGGTAQTASSVVLPSWRLSQSGINLLEYSWQTHCAGTPMDRCLDGCIRMRARGNDPELQTNDTAATDAPTDVHTGASTGTTSTDRMIWESFLPEDAVFAGSDGLAVAIFNAKKPDAIGDAVLGLGLIGLYATVVYSISKAIKAITYKLMHDILYTDMEKTGFVWAKIRDIYRARALARMCGYSSGQDGNGASGSAITMADGEEIDFYYIEERLWFQIHAIFRDASKLFKVSSSPDQVTVTIGYLPRQMSLPQAMGRRTALQNPKVLAMSYSSMVSDLMLRAVEALGFVSSGERAINIVKDYELRWYIASRQMVDSDVNPIDARKRLCDAQVRENELKKAIRDGDMLCLCRKVDEEIPGGESQTTIRRRTSRAGLHSEV